MFAILMSDTMDPLYQNILSFPTAVFSALLIFCVLFWLVAILGAIDISFLDLPELDVEGDVADGATAPHAVSAIILKLGLNGVPLTIIITLIALIGWIICYHIVYFLFDFIPGNFLRYIAGFITLTFTFYISALITGYLIKPLRPFFKGLDQDVEKLVMGQTAVVRTSRVDKEFGEATIDDGGAGLILKVRATGEDVFKKGDKVVLIEYLKEENVFRVLSEEEFNGL